MSILRTTLSGNNNGLPVFLYEAIYGDMLYINKWYLIWLKTNNK